MQQAAGFVGRARIHRSSSSSLLPTRSPVTPIGHPTVGSPPQICGQARRSTTRNSRSQGDEVKPMVKGWVRVWGFLLSFLAHSSSFICSHVSFSRCSCNNPLVVNMASEREDQDQEPVKVVRDVSPVDIVRSFSALNLEVSLRNYKLESGKDYHGDISPPRIHMNVRNLSWPR